MSDTREWWGEDVMPRIRWRIVVDALTLRRKEVADDGVFPPGYGLAWLLYDRPGAVCMPIPLNAICGWLRWAWIELCHGLGVKPDRRIVMAVVAAESRAWRSALALMDDRVRRHEFEADRRGYQRGYSEGRGHIVCPSDWIIPSAPDTKLDEVTPLERALQLATKAHAGQRDKQGLPYILHVLRVVNGCATDDERTVAALHDVVEDAGVTLKDLADFPAHILAAVDAITRREDEVYPDYIARAGRDYIARAVKIVDLRDNLSRAYQLPASAGTRLHFRYWRALEQLGASSPPEGEDT